MTTTTLQGEREARLIRGLNLPEPQGQSHLGHRVVARRDHSHITVMVVEFEADGEVWVAWTDGPRSSAERVESLEAALVAFAGDIANEVALGYFE